MSAVEKVQTLMQGESHVRHDESKQWAVTYRTALQEMAIELDAALAKIAALQYASLEKKWGVEVPSLLKKQHVAEKQQTHSEKMKASWARRKAAKLSNS